ncbi:hypothetical protein [Gracilimonas sp.]|uniref:hypothetical protein n=1 Tax=Gracilimonas sp. TaxID=1974203 RepID=UPI003BA9E455
MKPHTNHATIKASTFGLNAGALNIDSDAQTIELSNVGLYAGVSQTIHLEGIDLLGDQSADIDGLRIDKYNYLVSSESDVGNVLRVGDDSSWLQVRFGESVSPLDEGINLKTPQLVIDNSGANFSGTLTAPDGSLGSLDIDDVLTMGASGKITNAAGTYEITDDRISSRAFHSETFTINDNDYAELSEPIDGFGFVHVQSSDIISYATFSIRTSPSTGAAKQLDSNNKFEVDSTTGEPTGTSGTDGKITLFIGSSALYLENRSGANREFKILLIT